MNRNACKRAECVEEEPDAEMRHVYKDCPHRPAWLWVAETFMNATAGHMIGESPEYETTCLTTGELYREMQREYGKCISKSYIDTREGPPRQVGWVFQSRVQYEDSDETYLREVWVEVLDKATEVTYTKHPHVFG